MPTRWAVTDMPDQHGRIALVTGANAGIGFHEARGLASRGAHVLLASRDATRGETARAAIMAELPAASVELVRLDLADLDSVQQLADQVVGRHEGLDLLINNAGVMGIPQRRTTAQGFELQFGTNHLGHFALTGRLLPALLRRPGSRVVTVSSLNHRMAAVKLDDLQLEHGYSPWRAYNQSKLANALFTLELDRRLRAAQAETLSVGAHPGYTRTELQYKGPRLGGAGLQARALGVLTQLMAQPTAHGALPELMAATDPQANGGDYYGPGGFGELWGSPHKVAYTKKAHDEQLASRLWQASQELTGVTILIPAQGAGSRP
ncbi:MAG TPA: oxidoreductase [Streptosporangiaceae bacterium]|nr:oxidoreductase [Streptosporangiaceae bacterium]